MNDNNFNFNTPPVQQNNTSSDVSKIITIIMFLIAIGAAGFVLYSAYQNNQRKKQVLDKDIPRESYKSAISITDELISNVRNLIPKNGSCNNVYYAKQYLDSKFIDGNIDLEDLNSIECGKIPSVYYINAKVTSDSDRVYIYDLVLLFDPISGCYGRNNLVYNIEYDDIIIDVDEAGKGTASIKSLKEYGQVYKYTFRKSGENVYIYESTEPVEATIIDVNQENVQGEPEELPDQDVPQKENEDTEEDNPDLNEFDEEENEE